MKFFLISTFIFLSQLSFAQIEISGIIYDENSEEPLSYVNIGVVGKNIGTVSNKNGFYQLSIPEKFKDDTSRISMV